MQNRSVQRPEQEELFWWGDGEGLRVLSDHPPLPLDSEGINFCWPFIGVTLRNRDKQETKVTMKKTMVMTERGTLKVTVGLLLYQNKQALWAKMAVLKTAFLV